MSKRIAVMMVALMLLGTASAWGQYNVYKPVPDVDKPDRDGGGWPDQGDLSCWQACAANLLGGAGYGTAGTPQANATIIYNEMVDHFGWAREGNIGMAVNWWLYNHGLDPSDPNYGTSSYTDVTAVGKLLDATDYDFLLNELDRCQYVAVSWEFVDYQNQPFNHCLTLVGGNPSQAGPPNNVSVWHDSDLDGGAPPSDDDVYSNTFTPHWQINYPGTIQSYGQGYTILCPGLQKPESAVLNYDAAYYQDRPDGQPKANVWRVIGDNAGWGEPIWNPEQGDSEALRVPNLAAEDMQKHVYLLVDYYGRGYDDSSAPDIKLRVDNPDNPGVLDWIVLDPTAKDYSDDGGQILYTWILDHQPSFEDILFPDSTYRMLGTGDVKDFNIATECVPEPMSLGLLASGALLLLSRRRRR
jgi:hypothetical protein